MLQAYQIPQLDLRQLTSLCECTLKGLPAPGSLNLPPDAELALTISTSLIAGWSKLWHQAQNHVRYITNKTHTWVGGGYMCTHKEHLQEVWPLGIDAFHGLQYLQISCNIMMIWEGYEGLDLAHLAYIPYLSIESSADLIVKVSAGSWKVLDIKSAGHFCVTIDDSQTFLENADVFYLHVSNKYRPDDLIEKLRKAGDDMG